MSQSENIFETKFTDITNNNGKNFIIGVIYRPPNSNFETFKNTRNTILEKIDKENKICYLMGAFNINLFKSESCDYANVQFIEQLLTSSFFPLITKATRITYHTATLIDNIFTNNIEELDNTLNDIIFSDISDHFPIVHTFNTQGVLDKNRRDNVNNTTDQIIFNKASIETFSHAIKDISWNEILSEMKDTETAYNKFLKLFTNLYDANFPLKKP
jgi:hypothetical protein